MDPLDFSAYDVPSPPAENRENENQTQGPFESLGVDNDLDLGVDESATAGITRRPRAKMDSARILGDRGLPALQKKMLRFKFKGKGHEKRDLTKLLGTYQLWGHSLYPKANFDDFLVLCRRGGRDPAIKVYRKKVIDEEKYKPLTGATESLNLPPEADEEEPTASIEAAEPLEPEEPSEPSPESLEAEYPNFENGDSALEPDEDAYAAAMEAYQDLGF